MTTQDGRTARSEASKQAILTAATAVVADNGLSGLTHRAVAAVAGVSHALVTYQFATAAALRQATFGNAIDHLTSELGLLVAEMHDRSETPWMGGELAVRLATDLRAETLTTHELLLAASRNPELRPVAQSLVDRIADLLEPLTDDRERAEAASTALLGSVIAGMAVGADQDLDAFRSGVEHLVDLFDPHR